MELIYLGVLLLLFNVNETECLSTLELIEPSYFDNLQSLTIVEPIQEENPKWISRIFRVRSYYFWNTGRIKVFNGCDYGHITHELAHFKNNIDGVSLYKTKQHQEEFKEALEEITK